MSKDIDRRKLVKIITIGGVLATVALPNSWIKPVIQSVIVPAHAQASPASFTTTVAPTTAAPPTTPAGTTPT